ncbi:hypothetical protein IQ264_06705 [Phormidium sp. LEGE 05292]|uniref:hypothetical protein n=1 Tax=[Phormidium] sp. LEGE 05292 TaxID=767427 RepID=UPI0018828739|nr:hypothetical protein [Phormidium sp. LEGE 05292]MBE9225124.1 hypothetical protein [Phormidium sp. LEGE 05292]
MVVASKYWRLVRLDATGRRKVEEIESAKVFFQTEFSAWLSQAEMDDRTIQNRLLHLLHESDRSALAESCLRCFISNKIDQICLQLEELFGKNHGFTRCDLFSFVLDDVYPKQLKTKAEAQNFQYKSLATEILETFDCHKGSFNSWIARLVKHHRELNAFLLQHGVYLVSDWAILNDTNIKQLQRIFLEFHHLTPGEIKQFSLLLETYHAVYRRDRLKLRQTGGNGGQCLPPTSPQIEEMISYFQAKSGIQLPSEQVVNQLRKMADKLREYRIYIRGGMAKTEPLSDRENVDLGNSSQDEEEIEFLTAYRTAFRNCLDKSIESAISDRLNRTSRQKNYSSEQFIFGIHLFHCQQLSMSEIAALIGLEYQYQVSRLLKLKEFRADVRQRMLKCLHDCVLQKATAYTDPDLLPQLEQKIEVALNEQITQLINEAEAESTTPNRREQSLFAARLCHYLKKVLQN